MPTCQELIDSYIDWLKLKITATNINGACQITTPFLDRHNDKLQIYVEADGNTLRLTDDSYIISDLQASGCAIDTPNRRAMLQAVLAGFGIHAAEDELYVEATAQNFPQKKHALIQAMLAVNDMFMTARRNVATLFLEDVSRFLDENEVRYSPNVEFTGKSGLIHKFDFLIPKSKTYPERLIRAINHPARDTTTSVLFSWTDTKDVRARDSQFYVILNDTERAPSPDLLAAFQEYQVVTLNWSERENYIQMLAA